MILLGAIGLCILFAAITTMLMKPAENAWYYMTQEIKNDLVLLDRTNKLELISKDSVVKSNGKYGVVALKKCVEYIKNPIYIVIWHGNGVSNDEVIKLFDLRGDLDNYERQTIMATFEVAKETCSHVTVCLVDDLEPVLF